MDEARSSDSNMQKGRKKNISSIFNIHTKRTLKCKTNTKKIEAWLLFFFCARVRAANEIIRSNFPHNRTFHYRKINVKRSVQHTFILNWSIRRRTFRWIGAPGEFSCVLLATRVMDLMRKSDSAIAVFIHHGKQNYGKLWGSDRS